MANDFYTGVSLPLIFATGSYLAFFFLSHLLKRHLWINQILWCTAIGICLGPHVFGWIPQADNTLPHLIHVQEAARYAVAVQVVSSALSLPRHWLWHHLGEVLWLVGPVMLVSWLAVWGVALGFFSSVMHWAALLALAAALTPPDPVIIGTLVRGRFARSYVSEPLRHLFNAESGVAGGIAYMYFRLAVLLSIHRDSIGRAFAIWGWRCVAAEVLGAILVGLVFGLILVTAMNVSKKHEWMDHEGGLMLMMPAMALTLSAVDGYKGDGALAVSVMGSVVNEMDATERTPGNEVPNRRLVTDPMDLLSMGLFFVYFGASVVQWTVFPRYGIVKLIGFSLIVTLFRRLVIIPFVAYWILPSQTQDGWWVLNAIMLSVYAPVGAASEFFAVMYFLETGEQEVLDITTFVVLVSIVLFGVLSVPAAKAKKHWDDKLDSDEELRSVLMVPLGH